MYLLSEWTLNFVCLSGYKILCLMTRYKSFFDQKELKKVSSVMAFNFNPVESCVMTINRKPWARTKEVCRALEYGTIASKTAKIIRAHSSPENIIQKYQMIGLVSETKPVHWPNDSQKYHIYINEEGMCELLVGSQQSLAKELAEYMGNKIIGYNYVCKEAGTIYTIQKVFEGISMKRQFSIASCRIDLYFPEHKLAIKCDEHDHEDRDIDYEIRRQAFSKDQLNCKFIRYNPDAKDFTIESILNKIFQYVYQKRSS